MGAWNISDTNVSMNTLLNGPFSAVSSVPTLSQFGAIRWSRKPTSSPIELGEDFGGRWWYRFTMIEAIGGTSSEVRVTSPFSTEWAASHSLLTYVLDGNVFVSINVETRAYSGVFDAWVADGVEPIDMGNTSISISLPTWAPHYDIIQAYWW